MTCADVLEKHWGVTGAVHCCFSCHEDEAEGYNPLLETTAPSGEKVLLCCGAYRMVNEDG